jgi:predicted metal-binding transcription factor (methanogenesis marker protein 9)
MDLDKVTIKELLIEYRQLRKELSEVIISHSDPAISERLKRLKDIQVTLNEAGKALNHIDKLT